jgi:hypothetical protein
MALAGTEWVDVAEAAFKVWKWGGDGAGIGSHSSPISDFASCPAATETATDGCDSASVWENHLASLSLDNLTALAVNCFTLLVQVRLALRYPNMCSQTKVMLLVCVNSKIL